MSALIYIGLGIDAIGAIILLAYAVKYGNAFKRNERLSLKNDELKTEWRQKRIIARLTMLAGAIIALIGCSL